MLDRDLTPHQQRLERLQEQAQQLPALFQAAVGKDPQAKRKLTTTTFRSVERFLQDLENLEDRLEALNEIMEAQRQRVRTGQQSPQGKQEARQKSSLLIDLNQINLGVEVKIQVKPCKIK